MDYQIDPYSAINNAAQIISSTAQYMGGKALTREMWDKQTAYNTQERIAAQDYNTGEREASQAYSTSEREAMERYNREEWERNAKYNSPVAQLQRLRAAGVNPNSAVAMISGSPSSSLPSTSMSSSGASSPSAHGSPSLMDISHPYGSMMDAALTAAQVRKLNAESENQETANEYADESYRLSNEEKEAAISASRSSTAYQDALKGKTDKEIEWMDKLNTIAVNEGTARIDSLLQGIDKAKEEIQLIAEQQKTERMRQSNIDASTSLLSEQTRTEQARQQNIDASTENIDEDTNSKSLLNARTAFDNALRSLGFNPESSEAAHEIARMLALTNGDAPKALDVLQSASSVLRSASSSVRNHSHWRNMVNRYYPSRPDPIWNRR